MALYGEALALGHATIGAQNQIAVCLEGMAAVACAGAHAARSARLLGAATALRPAELLILPVTSATREGTIAAARAVLGTTAFEVAWAEGQAMTLEQAIAYAQEAEPAAGDGAAYEGPPPDA
jgi:hypothetical protein